MNKILLILFVVILIIASFFAGYSINKPDSTSTEIQNLQNQINSLQQQNNQLVDQVNSLQQQNNQLVDQVTELQEQLNQQENEISSINEEAECISKGGIWHKYLLPTSELLEEPFCQLPFADAGVGCTDSSQCIGNCEPPQNYLGRENGNWVTPYRENVSGTCSKFSKGCESYQIINGTLDLQSQAICAV